MEENILCCWLQRLYVQSKFVYKDVFVYLCTIINSGTFGLSHDVQCTIYILEQNHLRSTPISVGCVCKLSPYISLSLPSRCSQTPVTCRGTSALSTWGLELTPAPTAARPSPPPRALNNTNTSTLPSSPSYVSHSDPSYVSLHAFYSEHHTAELESSSILLKFLTNFESLILDSR